MELSIVSVPFTVRSPVTTRSPPTVTSSGNPIVTVPAFSATVTSFEVPVKERVPPRATGLVFDPSDTVIVEFDNLAFVIKPASILFSTEVA